MGETLRSFGALCLAFVMIGSIGVVPVASLAQAVVRATNPDALALAASDAAGVLQSAERWEAGQVAVRPVFGDPNRPIEVIIELSGRSLAAEQSYRAAMGLTSLDGAAQQAYVAGLRTSHSEVRAAIAEAGGTVRYEYAIVYNGVAAVVNAEGLARIAGLSGIVRVQPSRPMTIALDNSVPFIFGGETNEELGADGTGVTIAVIDTGVDYTHASLGGSGDVADYDSNDPVIIEAGTFPTAKVIGGMDLVGEHYDARGFHPTLRPNCTNEPVPDEDPLDINGHGSHVAGIAAGMGAAGVSQGVAPGASILAIKLFSGCAEDGSASTSSANVVAAIELAVELGADVINMSLGGGFGRETEATAVAANAAVDAGVIVVASAGNSGNIPFITGAPAAASNAISVAAGNDPGVAVQLVTVAGSAGKDADYEALEAAITPPLAEVGTVSGPAGKLGEPGTPQARACSTGATPAPPPPGSLEGKIALIQRGVCTFAEKILNAQAAGAIAVVVYNNVAGAGPIVMGGDPTGIEIPAVMVGTADGTAISGAIDGDTTFTLDPDHVMPIPDRLQSFTSRGPRFGDASMKPDVTAPGGSIASVAVGTGTEAASLSGTSMSSPHVAGVAALLRELHPDWSIDEIKSLIMNTATNASPGGGIPYPISLMGAGRVRVNVAVDTESVVVPGSASFGVVQSHATGTESFTVALEVRNKGDSDKEFSLSSGLLFASDVEGSVAIVHPATLEVGAGESETFDLTLDVTFTALTSPSPTIEEYDGFVVLTETTDGADVLRVPFDIIPIARADAAATVDMVEVPEGGSGLLSVSNAGIRSTVVDLYEFGVSDPQEDLIFEGPGMPQEPDDWFDIRHAGARVLPGGILEFVVTTHALRNTNPMMVTDIFLDVGAGSAPDYVVEVADLGLLTTGTFSGTMASAIFELTSGAGFLEFGLASEWNTARQPAPVLIADINELAKLFQAPKITSRIVNYFVVTTDLETGSIDVTGMAKFDAKRPRIFGSPASITLAAGASAEAPIFASKDGALLVVYRNNISGPETSEVVPVDFIPAD